MQFRFGAGAFALVVVLSAIFFVASRPAIDPDYGWHVANGRHVADGVLFAGRDVYSWTASGSRWIPHEWLTEMAMSAAHDRGGPTLNSIFAALLVTAAFALVAVRLKKGGFTWTATNGTVSVAFFSSIVSLGVRPQMLELLYVAAILLLIDAWTRGSVSTRWLYLAVAAGSTLWANSHGSFPLLGAIFGALSFALWITRDDRWPLAACAAVIVAVAALANPWGWELYGFAAQSIRSRSTLQSIQEWQRPNLLSGSLAPFVAELVLILCAIPGLVGRILHIRIREPAQTLRSAGGGPGPTVYDLFITLPIVGLGLQSGRHVMLAGICAAPLIASSIEHAVEFIKSRVRGGRDPAGRTLRNDTDAKARSYINLAAATAVAVALGVQAWYAVSPGTQRLAVARRYPVALVGYLETLNPSRLRLLNQYDWGGYIIERGRMKVFIDGRSEVYGDTQLDRYGSIIHLRSGWDQTLDSLGVNYVLMSRTAPLVYALRRRGWSEAARDSIGSLLRRAN